MAISNLSIPGIEIDIKDLGKYNVSLGTTLEDLCHTTKSKLAHQVVGGIINNKLVDLYYRFEGPRKLELVDVTSEAGLRIYRLSTVFILIKACRELFPERQLIIKHTLSNGLFCEFLDTDSNDEEATAIEARMREIVRSNLPIRKFVVDKEVAIRIFTEQGQPDKAKLLKFLNLDQVTIYELDGWYEYFYSYLVPWTGMINTFRVINYSPGIILQMPEMEEPGVLPPYAPQVKLAGIFAEAKEWVEMLHTPHLGALNEIIEQGELPDLIRVNEALHEKKIAYIADKICSDRNIRLVLIAGPSSSGKTTFAQRLLIQLRVNGIKPVSISLDNYFVDRDLTPRDETGDFDFEALEALKLDLFNDHLSRLIKGEEVEIPLYNFKQGTCKVRGTPVQVPDGSPIIIEGIHGLNERLTWAIPREQKFKIYISALTQLNIDNTNRIPTTDARLIRRIVRDSRTRGYSALNTIKRWPSVRRGEDKNIFPFQENADVMFNSSLVYELSILKNHAEPLLLEITDEHPEYLESRRLLRFLSYVQSRPGDRIPLNSILREFIGGSWFKV